MLKCFEYSNEDRVEFPELISELKKIMHHHPDNYIKFNEISYEKFVEVDQENRTTWEEDSKKLIYIGCDPKGQKFK